MISEGLCYIKGGDPPQISRVMTAENATVTTLNYI